MKLYKFLIHGAPAGAPGCAHGRQLHRTNTNFLLPPLTVDRKLCEAAPLQIAILRLPGVPSRAQLASELLSNLHHAAKAQHECMQYSSRSLVQCAMNRWTSTLRMKVESATTRPGFRSAAKPPSRERSESCLVCALRKIRTCLWVSPFRVEFRLSALSDRWAQTAIATETIEKRQKQLMGALLRDYASEEWERSAEHNSKRS